MTQTATGLRLLSQYEDVEIKQRARDYLVDGVSYRRVSTALGIIGKPALVGWAKRTTLERVEERLLHPEVMDGLRTLSTEPGATADEDYLGLVERLIADAKRAADDHRDAAAERGTSIHEEISERLSLPWEQRSARPEVNHALDFIADNSFEVEASEVALWDSDLQIAGTCDVVARDEAGRRVIWDWKTGSGPWWEMALQLGAYAGMVGRLTGEHPEEAYVVKLTPDGCTKHRVTNLAAAWVSFVDATYLHRASRQEWWE